MPRATTQVGSPKWTPVDHQADQVQAGQVSGQQVGERGLGHGHNPARHRRLAGPEAACSAWVPTGASPSGERRVDNP
jgi:hypothetical protein